MSSLSDDGKQQATLLVSSPCRRPDTIAAVFFQTPSTIALNRGENIRPVPMLVLELVHIVEEGREKPRKGKLELTSSPSFDD